MRYQNVHLESFGLCIPERVVPSLALEERLAPVYERLRIHPGRIELFSGIRERRHFEPGTRPSQIATQAAVDIDTRAFALRPDSAASPAQRGPVAIATPQTQLR